MSIHSGKFWNINLDMSKNIITVTNAKTQDQRSERAEFFANPDNGYGAIEGIDGFSFGDIESLNELDELLDNAAETWVRR